MNIREEAAHLEMTDQSYSKRAQPALEFTFKYFAFKNDTHVRCKLP